MHGETWEHYGQALERNLQDFGGLRRGEVIQATPYVPRSRLSSRKADGTERRLGIPALEDKIGVPVVTAQLFTVIWEEEFMASPMAFDRDGARIER